MVVGRESGFNPSRHQGFKSKLRQTNAEPYPLITCFLTSRAKIRATNTNTMWSWNRATCTPRTRESNARITEDPDCILCSDLSFEKYLGSIFRVMSLFNDTSEDTGEYRGRHS